MERLGFLDWGIGGIGILQAFRRRRPDVPVFYWSDTGATPYGRLPASQLRARVRHVLEGMAGQGVTHAVVACNAASTILPALGDVGIPVMGVVEPAIAMVSHALEQGVLGVVGGARTIRSGLYRRALETERRRVIQRIAQPLSAHIEAGRVGTPTFERDLRRILGPLTRATAILLACTHYPSADETFRRMVPGVTLLDPAEAVVETLIARWRLPRGRGDLFVTTGSAGQMRRAARWRGVLNSVRVSERPLLTAVCGSPAASERVHSSPGIAPVPRCRWPPPVARESATRFRRLQRNVCGLWRALRLVLRLPNTGVARFCGVVQPALRERPCSLRVMSSRT